MERIALVEVSARRRRGLEEVAVTLSEGTNRTRGVGRASSGVDRAEAAAEATIVALGDAASGVELVGVERITAGPVTVLQVSLAAGDEVWEGSCSLGGRPDLEAAARATLDALNPMWGA